MQEVIVSLKVVLGAPTLIKGLTPVQYKISVSVLDANTRVLQPKFSSL